MEELVALFVQLILEVGLQVFGSLGFDFATESRRRRDDGPSGAGGVGWLVAFAVLGGICGAVSLIFAPQFLLARTWMRVANLLVAPLLAGALSYAVAKHVWAARGYGPHHHFWRGFWFALLFGLVRFAYVSR